jgi:hypothetical protein
MHYTLNAKLFTIITAGLNKLLTIDAYVTEMTGTDSITRLAGECIINTPGLTVLLLITRVRTDIILINLIAVNITAGIITKSHLNSLGGFTAQSAVAVIAVAARGIISTLQLAAGTLIKNITVVVRGRLIRAEYVLPVTAAVKPVNLILARQATGLLLLRTVTLQLIIAA